METEILLLKPNDNPTESECFIHKMENGRQKEHTFDTIDDGAQQENTCPENAGPYAHSISGRTDVALTHTWRRKMVPAENENASPWWIPLLGRTLQSHGAHMNINLIHTRYVIHNSHIHPIPGFFERRAKQ